MPALQSIDHVHVHVKDRLASERWYQRVLGLSRVKALEFWAADGGPLTLADASGAVHIALFERPSGRVHSTIALRVSGSEFKAWQAHLAKEIPDGVSFEDHVASVSVYFSDPDGNPYEITTYDVPVNEDMS